MTEYQMVRGPDNTIWITLQPLKNTVKEILENSKNIKLNGMDEDEIRGINFTILSLESVYNFLVSLETEQEIKEQISGQK